MNEYSSYRDHLDIYYVHTLYDEHGVIDSNLVEIYLRGTQWWNTLKAYGFCRSNLKGTIESAGSWSGPLFVRRGSGDDDSLELLLRKPGFLGIPVDALVLVNVFEEFGGSRIYIDWTGQ